MAITNSDLRFKIDFFYDTSPKELTLSDYSDYTLFGHAADTIDGLIKIVGPSGIVYINAGYAADDFSAPDYTGVGADGYAVLNLGSIPLPLDADGKVELGGYTFYLKVKVTVGMLAFMVSTSKAYDYQYESVIPVLSVSHDCRVSTLTSDDDTDYDVVIGNDTFVPSSLTRDLTIVFPLTSGQPPQTTTADTLTVGPNIWTRNFLIYLQTDVVYDLEDWGTWNWFSVYERILGEESYEVICDDCSCTYYTCISNLSTQYDSALGSNLKEAERLAKQISKVNLYWMLYNIANRCGEDTSDWCAKIKAIAMWENCTCDTTDDSASVEVIPWASISGGGGGSCCQWHKVVGVPLNTLGNNGDFALDENAPHNLYYKIGGVYVFLGALDGNNWHFGAGVPGVGLGNDGDLYLDAVAPHNVYAKVAGVWGLIGALDGTDGSAILIIENNLTTSLNTGGGGEEILKSYLLDNTPTPVMDTDGDCLRVLAVYELAVKIFAVGVTLRLYLEGLIIGEFLCNGAVTAKTRFITIESEINRIDNFNQFIVTNIIRSGDPGTIEESPSILTPADGAIIDMSADRTIYAKSLDAELVPVIGDVICRQLKVELHPKV